MKWWINNNIDIGWEIFLSFESFDLKTISIVQAFEDWQIKGTNSEGVLTDRNTTKISRWQKTLISNEWDKDIHQNPIVIETFFTQLFYSNNFCSFFLNLSLFLSHTIVI